MPFRHAGSGGVEIPWWTYGAKGMQLWFPSSLWETLSPRSEAVSKSVDPELEFDKEVYPIGISLAEVAIIGQFHPMFTPAMHKIWVTLQRQDCRMQT